MDERRKQAYRHLLYQALLEIRPIAWMRWRNPLHWRRDFRRIRRAGELADWLHNLGHFSALDFVHFDEERFWRDGERLKRCDPEFMLEWYRSQFERHLVEPSDA